MANIFHRKTVFNEKKTNADFQKTKTKLGQKRKSTTETNLSFKSRGNILDNYKDGFARDIMEMHSCICPRSRIQICTNVRKIYLNLLKYNIIINMNIYSAHNINHIF